MSEHPSARQAEEYCRRQLQAGDFLEVHRHLLSCRLCAETYGVARPLANDYEALQTALLPGADDEAFHLTEEEAADYARGAAAGADAELAETHLEICPECAGLVARRRGPGVGRTKDVRAAPAGPKAIHSAPPFTGLPWGLTHYRLAVAASVLIIVGIVMVVTLRQGDRGGREILTSLPNPDPPGASPTPRHQDHASPPERERKEAGPDSFATPRPGPAGGGESPHRRQAPLVVLNDGGRLISLTRERELTGVPDLPPDIRRAVSAALLSARVETPRDLADLRGGRSVLLGEGDGGASFRPLSPVGVVTADTQPLLRWSPLPGATSYTVTLTDANYDEVATSGPVFGPEWRVPAPLVRGRTYAWQVAAVKDGEEVISPALPAPAARFKVLDRGREKAIRRAERRYAGSHLILGLLYARAGLLEEASREFRALSEANPNSVVPPKLLQSVR